MAGEEVAASIEFSTPVVSSSETGQMVLALIGERPPVVLTCSRAVALALAVGIAEALVVDRHDLRRAIGIKPT